MPDLKTIVLEVAQTVADKAKEDSVPFAEKTDALKALTQLYAITRKHPDEDDSDDGGFDFSKGVQPASQEQPNGAAARVYPSRRRPTVS